jgi:hypothetical protein
MISLRGKEVEGCMAQRNRKVVYALNWLPELVNRKHKKGIYSEGLCSCGKTTDLLE